MCCLNWTGQGAKKLKILPPQDTNASTALSLSPGLPCNAPSTSHGALDVFIPFEVVK